MAIYYCPACMTSHEEGEENCPACQKLLEKIQELEEIWKIHQTGEGGVMENKKGLTPVGVDADVIKSLHNSVCIKSFVYKAEWLGSPYMFDNRESWCILKRCNLCGLEFIDYQIGRDGQPQAKVWKGADTRLD